MLPRILVVHLKRFEQNKKLLTDVQFPLDNRRLEMGRYVVNAAGAQRHGYRLFAVSNHMGTLNGGHYTANHLGSAVIQALGA
jgi:ubiquitin C-terminal hydrolase